MQTGALRPREARQLTQAAAHRWHPRPCLHPLTTCAAATGALALGLQGAGGPREGCRPSPFWQQRAPAALGRRRQGRAGLTRPGRGRWAQCSPQESAGHQGGWVGQGASQVQRKVSGEAGVMAWPLSQSQEEGGAEPRSLNVGEGSLLFHGVGGQRDDPEPPPWAPTPRGTGWRRTRGSPLCLTSALILTLTLTTLELL